MTGTSKHFFLNSKGSPLFLTYQSYYKLQDLPHSNTFRGQKSNSSFYYQGLYVLTCFEIVAIQIFVETALATSYFKVSVLWSAYNHLFENYLQSQIKVSQFPRFFYSIRLASRRQALNLQTFFQLPTLFLRSHHHCQHLI